MHNYHFSTLANATNEEKNKDSIYLTEIQLHEVEKLVREKNVSGLCDLSGQIARHFNVTEGDYKFTKVLIIGFQMALSISALEFVNDLLRESKLALELYAKDQKNVLFYLLNQRDQLFREELIAQIIRVDISHRKSGGSRNFRINSDYVTSDLLSAIFYNPLLSIEEKSEVVEILLETNNDKLGITLEAYFDYFPKHKLSDQFVLTECLGFSLRKNEIALLAKFLLRHERLNPSELLELLQNQYYWDYHNTEIYQAILEKIGPTTLEYESLFSAFQLLSNAIKYNYQDSPEHEQHLLKVISSESIPQQCKKYVLTELRRNLKEELIKKHIADPSFYFPTNVADCLICDDLGTDILKKLLLAKHTIIPKKILTILFAGFTHFAINFKLVFILLNRDDFQVDPAEFIGMLNHTIKLLTSGEFRLVEGYNGLYGLFSHKKIPMIIKQYFSGHPDARMSDVVITTIIAWCAQQRQRLGARYLEIYQSVPPLLRRRILNINISSLVDKKSRLLVNYLLEEEIPGIIETKPTRLMQPKDLTNESSKSIYYLPVSFKKLQNNKHFLTLQRNAIQAFIHARTLEGDLHFQVVPTKNAAQEFAEVVIKHCNAQTFYLQHFTKFDNADRIFQSGRIFTRKHLLAKGINSNGNIVSYAGSVSSADNLRSAFVYFHGVMGKKIQRETPYPFDNPNSTTRIIVNFLEILKNNPHVKYMLLRSYHDFCTINSFAVTNEITLSSDAWKISEDKFIRVDLTSDPKKNEIAIKTALFQLLYTVYLQFHWAESKIKILIEKIISSNHAGDNQFIEELLGFLNVEWLFPGDVQLDLSFLHSVKHRQTDYSIADLHRIATKDSEEATMKVLTNSNALTQLPFLVPQFIAIAAQKKWICLQRTLVSKTSPRVKPDYELQFVPNIVYQIESLIQLILEDLNNERVYVQYLKDKIQINSKLTLNSNRDGAHHAQMALLHRALNLSGVQGQNAFSLQLASELIVSFGEGEKWLSLDEIMAALLTYEMTSLITTWQNMNYYKMHGKYHPITGKGATSASIALKTNRLFWEGQPYQIKITAIDDEIQIQVSLPAAINAVISALTELLLLQKNNIESMSDIIAMHIQLSTLIAKLRASALFYEGINVETADGKFLVAERGNHGLASAGGHHSNKYADDITYGLESEFALQLPPDQLSAVKKIRAEDTTTKTGIYVVPLSAVKSLQKSKNLFFADPQEFTPESEQILTLLEMRGLKFYDVMPLQSLARYQLNVLLEHLALMGTDDIQFEIDSSLETNGTYKIPSATFGRIQLTSKHALSENFSSITKLACEQLHDNDKHIFWFDLTVYQLISALPSAEQLAPAFN